MSNEPKYSYHVIEFITPGRKSASKCYYDIVATRWMRYDKNKGMLLTKFPPPPYTNEGHEIYTSLLKQLADAPDSWKEYHIKIKGRDSDYEEAVKKLIVVKNQDTLLSMDSEEEPADAEKRALDAIRRDQLMKESKEIQDDDLTSLLSHRSSTSMTELSNTEHSNDFGNDSILTNKQNKELNESILSSLTQSTAESMDLPNKENLLNNLLYKIYKIGHQIDQLQINQTCLINEVKRLRKILKNKDNNEPIKSVQQLSDKHDLSIPFKDLEKFQKFDSQIFNNKELLHDLSIILKSGLQSNGAVSRSIVSMLKLILDKQVAIQFNASKISSTKKCIMKDTNLYILIRDLIKEKKKECKQNVDDNVVNSKLSDVMSNVSKWYTTKKDLCSSTVLQNGSLLVTLQPKKTINNIGDDSSIEKLNEPPIINLFTEDTDDNYLKDFIYSNNVI